MGRRSVSKVVRYGLVVTAMMLMASGNLASAEQKTTLKGKLIECPDPQGLYCLQRADNKGVVTLLSESDEAPMYIIRHIDVMITMKIDATVVGFLKSPSSFAMEKGMTIAGFGDSPMVIEPGAVSPMSAEADEPPAGGARQTTLRELGNTIFTNQAQALALYGSAPGFVLTAKVAEIKVQTNQRGERFAEVRVGYLDEERTPQSEAFGESARLMCYVELGAAAKLRPGQKVSVAGIVAQIGKTRYNDALWGWRETNLVSSYPCSLSPLE